MTNPTLPGGPRCNAVILKRSSYRRTGRGRSSHQIEYTKIQCGRSATSAEGRCHHHTRRSATLKAVIRTSLDAGLTEIGVLRAKLAREKPAPDL